MCKSILCCNDQLCLWAQACVRVLFCFDAWRYRGTKIMLLPLHGEKNKTNFFVDNTKSSIELGLKNIEKVSRLLS